jgi:hypothetical protein
MGVISFLFQVLRLSLAVLLIFCGASGGQNSGTPLSSRTIEGSVFDRAGHAVPGAVVLIEDQKSLQVRSYIVQEDGKFRFRGLSADANYELRARFNGEVSGAKTVSVFDSKPTVIVNLILSPKSKKPVPPSKPTNPSGNPS